MSTYTPEEIKAIVSAPMNVGMAIAMVDMGIISTAIESVAMTKAIAGAAKKTSSQFDHSGRIFG